jgi:hypothetical protein
VAVWIAIRTWWRARQRRLDIEILWPEIVAQARDVQEARLAFAAHAAYDPAWREIGDDRLRLVLDQLEAGTQIQKRFPD